MTSAVLRPLSRLRTIIRQRGTWRVLIIVQNLPVPLDRRVWLECNALVAAGYDVSVICPKGPGDPAFTELNAVALHKYRPPPQADGALGFAVEFGYCWFRTLLLAVRIFATQGFAAIQACNPPDTYWALALPFKALGVRFVYDQHDLNPEVYESRFARRSGVPYRALRVLEWATYRTADHVVSTNDSYRQVALERGGKDPDDVTVVISGPDPVVMRRRPPQPELRRGRAHLWVWLGIMGPQDGVDLVLRAARYLLDHGRDDFHVALLGFGDCLDDLKDLAGELRLEGHVTFTGRAGPETVSAYLSTAAVGVTPDPSNPLNEVSTMNKTLEYMAFSLPVVATDLKETRITAGDAAVYFPSGDAEAMGQAVGDLLDQPDLRARMGSSGRRRVEEALGWNHQAPRYVAVFQDLLGSPRHQGRPTDA